MEQKVNKILIGSGLSVSLSEANRKIKEGAVFFNGTKIEDCNAILSINPNDVGIRT